jgi:hypothetical protein
MIEAGAVAAVVATAGGRVAAKPPAETVHLEVNGGAWTGTYNATSTSGGCTAGNKGPGSWTNELYVGSATELNALVNLPLTVPDAKAAAAGTPEFYLGIGFGPLARRIETTYQIEIDTRANQKHRVGSGTVTIDDKGDTATVTFDATTDKGEHLNGTITCNSVTRKK